MGLFALQPRGGGHGVNYLIVFVMLVLLTVATFLASFFRFHSELVNVLIAMIIATAKGGLVVSFFMHLRFEGKIIYVVLFVPLSLAGILVVALIPDVVMTDPIRHVMSSSMHWFNPISELLWGVGR